MCVRLGVWPATYIKWQHRHEVQNEPALTVEKGDFLVVSYELSKVFRPRVWHRQEELQHDIDGEDDVDKLVDNEERPK